MQDIYYHSVSSLHIVIEASHPRRSQEFSSKNIGCPLGAGSQCFLMETPFLSVPVQPRDLNDTMKDLGFAIIVMRADHLTEKIGIIHPLHQIRPVQIDTANLTQSALINLIG